MEIHHSSFEKLKEVLQSDLLLTHFDPEMNIIIAADASDYGVGAVISHQFAGGQEKAIAHAGRALTKAEKNYGQIEKEALALVFAVRKFHRFVYGRRFTLLTDHKPLLSIFGSKKGISAHAANRLQRWELILLAYDFKIEYRRTANFGQADALSRLIDSKKTTEVEDLVIASVNEDTAKIQEITIRQLPVTKRDIREATNEDLELKEIIKAVKTGIWPKIKMGTKLNAFHSKLQDFTLHEGILFMGSRAIIPNKLQHRILKMLHEGHPGITRMKMLARQCVYWQGIDRTIEDLVKSCDACPKAAKMPIKNILSPWPEPSHAWERIHIDFAGPMENAMFLIVVDAYSKWPEVIQMKTITSMATICVLSKMFARYGFPETLVSDNGTQFTSAELERFCQTNSISHVRIPPGHPQSNGQAERFVDTFKRTIQKLKGEGVTEELVQKFLLTYRSKPCPASPDQKSPAESFIGRQIRTPLSDLQLQIRRGRSTSKKSCMKKQFDKKNGARPRLFKDQETIYVRDFKDPNHTRWIPGKVIKRIGKTVYDVEVGRKITRRHTNQLRPRYVERASREIFEAFDLPEPPRVVDIRGMPSVRVKLIEPAVVEELRNKEERTVPSMDNKELQTEEKDVLKEIQEPATIPTTTFEENHGFQTVPEETQEVVLNPEEYFQEETAPMTRPKRLRNPPKRLVIDTSKKNYDFI